MFEGAKREAWHHTSSVLCMMANARRDPKKKPKPFSPRDFDPTQKKRGRNRTGIPVTDIQQLKVLVPNRRK